MEIARTLYCLAIGGWAAVTDLRWHKIKNYTVLAGILGGICLNLSQLRACLLGMLLPLLLFALFAAGIMRAGDVKLLCALGAVVGFPSVLNITLYALVFCGACILLRAVAKGQLSWLLHSLWRDLRLWLMRAGVGHKAEEQRLPFAGCVWLAALYVRLQVHIPLGWGFLY